MAKTKLGSNAIFSGPQKGLSMIGSHCYAYSGPILSTGSDGADDQLLSFNTGKGYIIADCIFQNDITSGSNTYFEIKYNGQTVVLNKEASSSITEPWTWIILIPPLTFVEMGWGTQSGVTNFKGTVSISGKVYA